MRDVEESAIARQTERRDDFRHEIDHLRSAVMKVEPLLYGDRKVYSVAGFNRGVADWLSRLPTLWIEGEVTELRRNDRWGSVFFTLKDPEDGACLPASIPRRTFDALKLDLGDGERIHVLGRAELYAAKGEFRLRALSLERFGLGAHLAAIERLKQALAAEGVFDASRKRPLPRFPRRIGLVTGSDAAARRDVITTIQTRFPPARVLVAETLVQGPRGRGGDRRGDRGASAASRRSTSSSSPAAAAASTTCSRSATRASCVPSPPARCPIVSAVGHEQDTPLCDLAADVRASTPTAAGQARRPRPRGAPRGADPRPRLARTLRAPLDRTGARRADTDARGARARRPQGARPGRPARLRPPRAPAPRARPPRRASPRRRRAGRRPPGRALAAGHPRPRLRDRPRSAIRSCVSAAAVAPGEHVDVELAEGAFGARVDEVRP